MAEHYSSGSESGVNWYLDWNGDTMFIHVEKAKDATVCLEEEYVFQWRPIFGFDAMDVNIINEKLDSFIKMLSE